MTPATAGVPWGMGTDRERRIAPYYAARLEDLRHADAIGVECLAREHQATVPVAALRERLAEWCRVAELWRVLRCENCGAKAQATVDARKALGCRD